MKSNQRRTLSRTSSYLDGLATALRDLGGPTTIPHELVQNADDSGNATAVRFTVDNEALTVWNDGTFTDCLEDGETCPWTRRCDLHAFRRFAGRTKADDPTTTGAFGVGFTSVYQITDRPELLYADQHWFIDETAAENERLQACDGSCPRDHNASGTTFVLPWAREKSALRSALSVSPVLDETLIELEQALLTSAKSTLLFLQHVSRIEIHTRSRHYWVEMAKTDNGAVVTDCAGSTKWFFLIADFGRRADSLVASARGLIDARRSSSVTVALSLDDGVDSGVLYATLPTQTPSGLPGHVNAAFFPSTDRKAVRFERDIYSEWNSAAIEAVASVLADRSLDLSSQIGITGFWRLVGSINDLARKTVGSELNIAQIYLDKLYKAIPALPLAETTDGSVIAPKDAFLPAQIEAYDATEALNSIKLPLVSMSLHRILHTNGLYTPCGFRLLTARHVVQQLSATGITSRFEPSTDVLTAAQIRETLALLSLLQGKVANVAGIQDVAIVPCRNGLVAPASEVIWPSSTDEAVLFEQLVEGLLIADTDAIAELCPGLKDVCIILHVGLAADLLQGVEKERLSNLAGELLAWFEGHLLGIGASIARKIAELPIFLTSNKSFLPLTMLSLPEDFEDPIKVANLVNHEIARDYHRLLYALGARPLNVVRYFLTHVLPAAMSRQLTRAQALRILRLVAQYQVDLAPHRDAIANAPLIPGIDGVLYAACELHLPTSEIRLIAPDLPVADTNGTSVLVLEWLGVPRVPTDRALETAANWLAEGGPDPESRIAEAVLKVLRERVNNSDPVESTTPPSFLVSRPWLPLRSGGTGRPCDVLPTNARHLYGSQGKELGIPFQLQQRYFSQLTWLGMPATPPVRVVVEHLRHCAETGTEINPDVYRVLSNNASDNAVRQLRDFPCVHVGKGTFVSPSTAFWGRTPFGRWGTELPSWLREYQKFFDAVGVREEPGPRGVAAVLNSILDEFGTDRVDDDAAKALHGSWSLLSELVDHPDAAPVLDDLRHSRSALDPRGVLEPPVQLFFEDSRGMHHRFRLLANNVIPRVQATLVALERAGVRRVEELISARLHGGTPQPDDWLPERVTERIGVFRRLLNDDAATQILQQVEIFRAHALAVTFRAVLHGYSEEIGPDPTDAIYLRDEARLVYSENCSSRALARELARAIYPDDDPGRLAIQLQPVIDAASPEEAHATLDEYGIDRLDTEEHEVAWSTIAQANNSPQDTNDADATVAQSRAPNKNESVPEETERQILAHGGPLQTEVCGTEGHSPKGDLSDSKLASPAPGAAQAVTKSRASGDTIEHDRGQGGESGQSGQSGSGAASKGERDQRSSSGSAQQTRLRSYVLNTDQVASVVGTIGDEAPDSTPIDAAGVARVVAYEKSCGRTPHEMNHSNPGFDMESFDRRGNLIRRIEIKSTGGAWSSAGVMLSRRQHRQARDDGKLFWLYIVENAEDDENYKIFRIQDPAGRIDYFGFDDGWKTVAEPDIERDEAGMPFLPSTRSIFTPTWP